LVLTEPPAPAPAPQPLPTPAAQPPATDRGAHPEVTKLREEVKSLQERLAALEAKSPKAIPAARVGQIIVVGNTKTPTDVIVKQLAMFPGRVLEYPALRQAENKLAKWKATVTIAENGEDSTYKDILVTVKEK
jgi:hypothetical protein